MYTSVVKKTKELPTELGRRMRAWRKSEDLTVAEAAGRAHIVKSTWSNLERGVRQPETETLLLLEQAMGIPMDELARMAGFNVRASQNVGERARRVAALAEGDPRMQVLIGLLAELSPEQIDTLVSVAEGMRKSQTDQAGRRIDAE